MQITVIRGRPSIIGSTDQTTKSFKETKFYGPKKTRQNASTDKNSGQFPCSFFFFSIRLSKACGWHYILSQCHDSSKLFFFNNSLYVEMEWKRKMQLLESYFSGAQGFLKRVILIENLASSHFAGVIVVAREDDLGLTAE